MIGSASRCPAAPALDGGLVAAYLRFTQAAFAPDALPTWLPRLAVLVLGVVGAPRVRRPAGSAPIRRRRARAVLVADRARAAVVGRGRPRTTWRALWDLVRGAAPLKQPAPVELGRRYMELVGENLGQPGFRELVLVVHDLDARRDLTFALVGGAQAARDWSGAATIDAAEERRAEVFDLAGVARDYLADIVGGALAVPLVCEPRAVTFAPDAYWRGETHRLCDRPGQLRAGAAGARRAGARADRRRVGGSRARSGRTR